MDTDYKYIEELLEKYQECKTSLEEEETLRLFFTSDQIPDQWLSYRYLFCCQQVQQSIGLGEEFDKKLLARLETPVVKAKRITLRTRPAPLFKSAAVIAVLISITHIIHHSFVPEEMGYNYDAYTDTYDDPQVAY
ncbi:MAG: hypothetical protein LUD15_06875 [Bacteroides sp.]|nr:hypothetical protein [Bacteroides sp.]